VVQLARYWTYFKQPFTDLKSQDTTLPAATGFEGELTHVVNNSGDFLNRPAREYVNRMYCGMHTKGVLVGGSFSIVSQDPAGHLEPGLQKLDIDARTSVDIEVWNFYYLLRKVAEAKRNAAMRLNSSRLHAKFTWLIREDHAASGGDWPIVGIYRVHILTSSF
jgi:hypothetical protein